MLKVNLQDYQNDPQIERIIGQKGTKMREEFERTLKELEHSTSETGSEHPSH